MTTKHFRVIEYGEHDGRARTVALIAQTAHESAGAERAVAAAATIARVAGDGCYRIVREVAGREIAVVGADGPVSS